MPLKDFLYYLTEEDGRSLKVQSGVVTATGIKSPLLNTPDGWQDIAIAWERIMKYYGLNRNFSVPLSFYMEAAFMLRHEFYNRNVERKLFLLIQRLSLEYEPSYYKWLYTYLYKGELDFSTFKSDRDKVTIQINEGGLTKLFKANENTTYSFPMDEDADVKYLFIDPIEFDQNIKMAMPGITTTIRQYIMPVSFISADQASSTTISVFTSQYTQYFGGPTYNFEPSQSYFLKTTKEITVRIYGSIKVTSAGSYSFWIVGSSNNSINPSNYPNEPGLYYIQPAVGAGSHTFNFDVTLNLPAGEALYFYATHPFDTQDVYEDTDINIEFKFKFDATTIKFFLPFDMFKKLCGKVTGDETVASSTLLQTTFKDYAITCGDAIRGLSGVSIKTSMSQFFTDYDVTCFAGLSIDNGKIKIEDRATFFDPSNPIDLGNIKNHEVSYAADLAGSTLKVGHVKPDIEDINGRFDPNGSTIFTLPITRVAKEIDLTGPYKKGPYEIEITRINLDGKTTTDNNNDNDCFVIHVKAVDPVLATVSFTGQKMITPLGIDFKVGMRIVIEGSVAGNDANYIVELVETVGSTLEVTLNEPVVTESNVPVTINFPYILNRDAVVDSDPDVCPSPETIFNTVFTPKNILNKHARWIRSILTGFDTEKIKFQSGEKNTKFLQTIGTTVVDEDTDVDINAMGDRLFLNYYHEIETLVPIDLVELLEANPNRCFRFFDVDLQQHFTGFNIKAGIAPNMQTPQSFKLLSAPGNDLTKLVY